MVQACFATKDDGILEDLHRAVASVANPIATAAASRRFQACLTDPGRSRRQRRRAIPTKPPAGIDVRPIVVEVVHQEVLTLTHACTARSRRVPAPLTAYELYPEQRLRGRHRDGHPWRPDEPEHVRVRSQHAEGRN